MRFPTSVALSLFFALSMGLPAQSPARLDFYNTTRGFGTFALGGPTSTVIAPGEAGVVSLAGSPGATTALVVSLTPPPLGGVAYQGVPVGVDWTSLTVLWDGFSDPSAPIIPVAGVLLVNVVVPPSLPLGTNFYLQAIVAGLGPGPPSLTNAIVVTVAAAPLSTIPNPSPNSAHPLAQSSAGGLLIVADQPSWTGFWSLHAPGAGPPPPVDFSAHFVLASFQGFRPFGGTISVLGAYLDASGVLQVYTMETYPGIPAPPSTAFDLVLMPMSSLASSAVEHRTQLFLP